VGLDLLTLFTVVEILRRLNERFDLRRNVKPVKQFLFLQVGFNSDYFLDQFSSFELVQQLF